MDCTHAEMLLVEHVTGELPEATRVDLEAHLATCERCRALSGTLSLGARYAAVLPIEEPPKLDMSALRTAMRKRAPVADPDGPSNTSVAAPEPTGAHAKATASVVDANARPGYGEIFRKWVTGPQVAMATLTCLVLAIGLTYIPLARRDMPADGDTVAAPAEEAQLPAARVAVGEAPATEADLRAPVHAPTPGQAAPTTLASADEPAPSDARDSDQLGIIDGLAAPADEEADAPAVAAIVPPAPVPAVAREARLRDMQEVAEPESATNDRFAATGSSGRAQGDSTVGGVAPSPPPATQVASASATTAPPTATSRGADPSATLAQARSLRSSGACGAASNVYQTFLREAGSSHPQRGPAMLELADCLRRTGRTGVARQTLEQAQAVPSVSAQARRELERSSQEQQQQAPPRSARPAAAPAERYDDSASDSY